MQRYLTPIKSLLLACLAGIVAGTFATLFLVSLHWVVQFKTDHEWLLLLLPIAGLILGRMKAAESSLILEEVHSPKDVLPIRVGPQIWISTLISHGFGASVGREGAATHIGASFADQIARLFRVTPTERKTLLVCGLGAGLSAAIGTPWAGAIFGLELFRMKNMRFLHIGECIVASFIAYFISRFIHASEPLIATNPHLQLNFNLLIAAAGSGLVFGFLALLFESLHQATAHLYALGKVSLSWRPVIGGAIFASTIYLFSLQAFESLSVELARNAFSSPSALSTSLLKLILTAFSIGSGFRGGEFTPLVVAGASMGSWMESHLQTGTLLLPALGCTALFGTTARVPITATIMTIEWFGLDIGLYAVLSCFTAYGTRALFGRKANPVH